MFDDLEHKMADERSDGQKNEMNAKHSFEMLKQSLENTIAQDNKELAEARAWHAGAMQMHDLAVADAGVDVVLSDAVDACVGGQDVAFGDAGEDHVVVADVSQDSVQFGDGQVAPDALDVDLSDAAGAFRTQVNGAAVSGLAQGVAFRNGQHGGQQQSEHSPSKGSSLTTPLRPVSCHAQWSSAEESQEP